MKQKRIVFCIVILSVLVAFQIFNFSVTQFALSDLLGDISFIGMRWATILSFAFCGIDFAGIARIFTPEKGRDEPAEVWYLLGAWFLAATLNASLIWWGVSVAMIAHGLVIGSFLKIVPIIVAALVLLIRVLLINTFSIAGERLFLTNS